MLLFTTLNTVGRMVGGYMPERLLHRYGTPRWEAKHTLENLPVENNDTLVIMAAINLLAAVGMLRCDRERPFAALHCQRRGACAHAQDGVCCGGVADGVRAALATAVSGLRLLLPCAMFGGFVFGWHWSLMPVRCL